MKGLHQAAEHEFEAAHGLPEPLPPGERLLWQGRPDARVLAREMLHLRGLSLYFAAMLLWRGGTALADGHPPAEAALATAGLLVLSLLALGLLGLLTWLVSRTTVYTVTDRRVVMRIGIVLGITFNLPLRQIDSAGLRLYRDGSGDLALRLDGATRIGYVHLWPHARPWEFKRTQPMLRAVPQAAQVAELLAGALRGTAPRVPAAPPSVARLPLAA